MEERADDPRSQRPQGLAAPGHSDDPLGDAPFPWLPRTLADFVCQIVPREVPQPRETPRASPAPDRQQPFDINEFLNRCMGNRKLARDLLRMFVERAGGDIQRLSGSIAARDSESTAQFAHTFRGVAGNLSAASAEEAAGEIERLAITGDFEAIAAPLARLRHEVERCIAAIADGPEGALKAEQGGDAHARTDR